jgi:8-oxo-dGTP pyrophosphatase MutT (NUDIX family)
MKPGKLRAIALGVFRKNNQILVAQGYDAVKKQSFFRPLGGTIEFGEPASLTVQREIQEELGLDSVGIVYLGTLENIFTFEGQLGHEIVMIFDGEFVDLSIYEQSAVHGVEGDGEPILALWKDLDEFSLGNNGSGAPLYPTGLLELLQGKS